MDVILHDGKNHFEIKVDDIRKMSVTRIVELYRHTAKLHNWLNDVSTTLVLVPIALVTPAFMEMVGDGWFLLRSEIVTRLGEDSAEIVFGETLNLIKNIAYERA